MSEEIILATDIVPKQYVEVERTNNPMNCMEMDGKITWEDLIDYDFSPPPPCSIIISKNLTSRYADPFKAFSKVLPLFTNVVEFEVEADSPVLTEFLHGWQPDRRWRCVTFCLNDTYICNINVHFTDMENHSYCFHSLFFKHTFLSKPINDYTSKLDPEKFIQTIGQTIGQSRTSLMTEIPFDKWTSSHAYADAAYRRTLEPHVSFRMFMSDSAAYAIRHIVKSFSEWKVNNYYGESSNRIDGDEHNSIFRCPVSQFTSFQSSVLNILDSKGLDNIDERQIVVSPIDRFPTHQGTVHLNASEWRDGLSWFRLAEVRRPYMASLLCDIMLGFGPNNMLPVYVTREIFDWFGISHRWTPVEIIKTISRIYKSIQRVLKERDELSEKLKTRV